MKLQQTSAPPYGARRFFAFLCFSYLLFMNPSFVAYDVEAYLVAENILLNGNIALSEKPLMGLAYDGGVPGRHGKRYSRSGFLAPAITLPIYALGMVAERLLPAEGSMVKLFLVLLLGPILAALCGMLVYLIAVNFYRPRTALYVAFIYSLGSMAFPYSNLRTETSLAACILTMLLGILNWSDQITRSDDNHRMKWALVAGLGAGAAIATKSYALLLTLPGWVLFIMVWRHNNSRRDFAAFFAPILVFGILQAAYNGIRFGSPFATGYAATFGFDLVHLAGCLWVLFLSPAKSVFLFCPALIASILCFRSFANRNPLWAKFILAQTLLLVLFISTFREPLLFADEIWGSRYLFPIVGLWIVIAGVWLDRGGRYDSAVWILGIAGFMVSLPGVLIRQEAIFVYSGTVCAAPEYCRLLDPDMNAIFFNLRLLFGSAPSFLESWSHPWIWWIQALKPSAINPARIGEVTSTISPAFRVLAVVAASVCALGAVTTLVSLLRLHRPSVDASERAN